MAPKTAPPKPAAAPVPAPEPKAPVRDQMVFTLMSLEEYEALQSQVEASGYSRSAFLYALLNRATKGFTVFPLDAKALPARHRNHKAA